MGSVNLPVAVNAPDTLLQVHRVPRKIMIEKHAGELQIDALAARSSAYQHARAIRALEPALSSNFGAVITSLEYVHASTRKRTLDRGLQ